MRTQVRAEGGIRVLQLRGDLKGDEETIFLKETLDDEVARGARQFVIDLSQVGLVNSLGIGGLVACLTSVRKRQGEVKFCGASHRVIRALDHCRLLEVVEHFPALPEALRSFSPTKA